MSGHLDFETRSNVDIKKVGGWAYAMHKSTEITCIGFGTHPGAIRVLGGRERSFDWGWSDEFASVFDWRNGDLSAHNSPFEYAIYGLILHRRYGWPARWDPKLWSCTMARAAMCGLPLDLDSLGRVLEIKTPKDIDGRKVMLQLARPIGKDPLTGDAIFDESPAKYETLYRYNMTDVRAEMEVDALLPEMTPGERAVWELDLVVNRRGVGIDLPFARKAAALSDTLMSGLNARLMALTAGAVDKSTQVAALKVYLKSAHGVEALSLDKEAVTDLLADPLLPKVARDVLVIRRQASKKNSVAKYVTAVESTCPDGRARGLLQYHAAHTGRWGGRGLQPQNFPKGFDEAQQRAAIDTIMEGNPALLTETYGDKAMDALSDALRGLFIPGQAKTFMCADFNAIEARVLFWLASDYSALGLYKRGESPYVEMANYIYKRTDITKKGNPAEYDIGKRTILGCGYGMGAEKFRATIYTETAKTGRAVVIPFELAERAVKAYREKYASVKNSWYEVERAAINAVQDPTKAYPCCGGKVMWGMTKDRRFLACKLPSGRFLRYWRPSVRPTKTPWGEEKAALHYWGVDSVTKQWVCSSTYGGALVENVTQAVARDLLAHGMLNVQAAGYDVVLTVHDEVLAECSNPANSAVLLGRSDTVLDKFVKLLCDIPVWAAGCPVAAEGWTGGRYRK